MKINSGRREENLLNTMIILELKIKDKSKKIKEP